MSEKTNVTYQGPSDFVHLHCHTIFSMLDGVASPEQYFRACKERGWTSLAITEHGNLASVPDNYFAAKENGIKYIPACEIYFNDYELFRQRNMAKSPEVLAELRGSDKGSVRHQLWERVSKNRHLTVHAMNANGFSNIVKLTTQAFETGFYRKPRVWFAKLVEYGDDIMVLSGCLNGPISYELRRGNLRMSGRGAVDYIEKFKSHFGDRFYIEVQMPCLPDNKDEGCEDDYAVFQKLIELSKQHGVKAVLTNDSHYLARKDFQIQKLMMAIDQDTTIADPTLFYVNSEEQYFKTRADLYETFKTHRYSENVSDRDFEWICENTLEYASKCENFVPDITPKIPKIENADQKLRDIVMTELKNRGLYNCAKKYIVDNREVTYLEQAEIELQRFIEKGFASYFLITADLVDYSVNKLKAPIGPRGSAGGALVNYLLGISELDPLKWHLSSTRFMGGDRGGHILNIKAE